MHRGLRSVVAPVVLRRPSRRSAAATSFPGAPDARGPATGGLRHAPDAPSRESTRSTRANVARSTDAAVSPDLVLRLASACAALVAGVDVLARHARDVRTERAVRALGETMRGLASRAWRLGVVLGHERRRGARTCDRLRWEWLAATAAQLDGGPDLRVAIECARVARAARDDARRVERSLADGPAHRGARELSAALDRASASLDDAVREAEAATVM